MSANLKNLRWRKLAWKVSSVETILYDGSMFSILAKGRSPFHLSALEATFIKPSNPILCR